MEKRFGLGLGLLALSAAVIAVMSLQRPIMDAASVDAEQPGEVADMGDFWVQRATYPTGHFNPQWQIEAAEQVHQVPEAIPAGAAQRAFSNEALDPVNFTSLGPRPLGTAPGVAGRINVVVSHPTDGAIAWAGSDGGGIWKTTNCCDANTTWTIKTDIPEIQNSAIGDMVLDPNNPNVLYAATGDLRFGSFSFGSNGVLKSTDGGETWTVKGADVFNPFYPPSANAIPQYQAIGQVEVDPNNSNIVVAGTKTGMYFSYNAGESWTGPCLTNAFTSQRQDMTGIVMRDLGTTTQLIASIGTRGFETPVQPNLNQNGANGVYRATVPALGCPADWQLISRPDNGWPAGSGSGTPTPTNTLGRIDLAIAPSNQSVIYAQVARINATSPDILGVWRTANGGDSWTQATVGDISGAGTQSWYNAGMAVSPTNPDVVMLSGLTTFRSTTGGSGFANITPGSVHVDHHGRAFVAGDPNRLLIGTDGGVYYSGNATAASPTWLSLNTTLNTIEFYSGTISENFATAANASAVGGAQDNSCMLSNWSGGVFGPQSWSVRNGGDGFFTSIEPILGNRWYYSSQNGNIRVTSVAQSNSTVSATPSGWTADRKSFLTNFELYRFGGELTGCPAATGCGRIIAGSQRVWESVSGGVPTTSWLANSPDLTKGTLGARSFLNQVSYATSTPTIAIAGSNDGNVAIGFNMGQNVANSATWVNVTSGNTVLANRPVLDVFLDPVNPLIGYAAVGGFDQNTPTTPGHVFQVTCTANCASFSWRDVSGNLPNVPANSVIVNPLNPKQVFVGTDWGLFFTDNIDVAVPYWNKHAGLPSVMIWDMTFDRGFTTLSVWTRSRGAWVWPLPSAPATGIDVAVTLAGPSTPVSPGGNAVYTATITNSGPEAASTVALANVAPAGFSFVSNSGDCTSAFPCNLGTLASGESRSISTTFLVPAGYVDPVFALNSVSVSSAGSDLIAANNTASTRTSIALSADLGVSTIAPATVLAGNNLVVVTTIGNSGASTARNIVVGAATPPGLSFVSNTGDCASAFPCAFATLAAGAQRTITTTYAVPANYSGTNPIATTVSIAADDLPTDSNLANNTITTTTQVGFEANLDIAISGPAQVVAGSNVQYLITLTSTGPSAASAVSVSDITPPGLTFISNSGDCSGAFPCNFATLMPGVPRSFTATFNVPAGYAGPNPLVNTVSVTATTTDPVTTNNSNSATTTVLTDAVFGNGFE